MSDVDVGKVIAFIEGAGGSSPGDHATIGADGLLPAAIIPAAGGGTVQGTDGTYDLRATNEGATSGNARGESSVDLQTSRAAADDVAAGDYGAIGGGRNNSIGAGVDNAITGGNGNQVLGNSNNSSIAGGSSNTIAGSAAVFGAIGGGASNIVAAGTTGATVAGGSNNQAAADYSTVPGGRRGFAERHGEFAYNVGPTSGKNQTGFCLARKLTTDATKAEAFLDGVSEQMTLSTGDALKMRVEVIASDETTSKHAIWTVDNLLIHRNGAAASTSLVGGSTGIVPDVSVGTGSGWRLDLTADTTNAAIRVEVTGEAAVSIEWTVRISYIQVKTNGV